MIRFLAALLVVLPLQDPEVKRILEKAEASKPAAADLAFWSHDWAPSLEAAKERAAKEGRPVFFTWVTNITGPDDFFSGHC